MMFYKEDALYAIASAPGKQVKIDINTSLDTKEWYARVCVKINLTKPLVGKFWLDGSGIP